MRSCTSGLRGRETHFEPLHIRVGKDREVVRHDPRSLVGVADLFALYGRSHRGGTARLGAPGLPVTLGGCDQDATVTPAFLATFVAQRLA